MEQKEKYGYEVSIPDGPSMKKICIPFADDFNLITKNKIQHQKLQDDLQEKVQSMGLTLKPKKCRAMSISSGRPVQPNFTLVDYTDPANPSRVILKDLKADSYTHQTQPTNTEV